jgi:hypothetical protein
MPFTDPDAAVDLERFISQELRMCQVTQEEPWLPYSAKVRLSGMSDDDCIGIAGPEKDSTGLGPVGGRKGLGCDGLVRRRGDDDH